MATKMQLIKRKVWLFFNQEESQKFAKTRVLSEIEKEIQKKNELEKRFEKLKEKEEELIKMFEDSNFSEKQAMTDLKTLLYGKNADSVDNANMLLNGTISKIRKN